MLGNALTGILIAAAVIAALRSLRKRAESGCCNAGGERTERVKVSDKDASHYPYTALLQVEDMHCQSCHRRVENALNRLDGVWGSVENGLSHGNVRVRMKKALSEKQLRSAIQGAGYGVSACYSEQQLPD